jgi:hypothetical protein
MTVKSYSTVPEKNDFKTMLEQKHMHNQNNNYKKMIQLQ